MQVISAAAAGASLEADPNPVTLLSSSSSGETTISWETGDGSVGKVTVQEGNGPEQQFDKNDNGNGTKKATVAYGTTYKFRLYAKKDGEFSLLLKTLSVKAKLLQIPLPEKDKPRPKLDFGCLVQCLTDVKIAPHGTFADVAIKTSEPAMILLEASTEPPNADLTFSGKPIDSSLFTLTKQTALSGTLQKLEPNTTYHFVVSATDANQKVSKKSGTFKTLVRQVKVTWHEIHLIEDSDPMASGEIYLSLWANDQPPFLYKNTNMDSGTTKVFNKSSTLANAPASLTLNVRAADSDELSLAPGTYNTDYCPYSPYDSDCEWAKGSQSFDLLDSTTETFTQPFSITAHPFQNGDDLKLKVTGSIEVLYK